MIIETLINKVDNIYLQVITNEDYEKLDHLIKSKNGKEIEKMLISKYGIKHVNVLCYGDTEDINSNILKDFIPEERYPLAPAPRGKSYKCYANDAPSIVVHEDLHSSWKCLMNTLNNPKYAIIYKK